MAAKRGRVEIIEVLPDDSSRPVPRRAVPVDAAPRRQRWWIPLVAVVAIAAVVIGADVLSDDGAPATRSTATTGAASTTIALAPDVLPLVPTIPLGYRVVGVEQSPKQEAAGPLPVRQLWATNSTASFLGSWIEITASRTGIADQPAGDRRVPVPGGTAVLVTHAGGDISIVGPLAGGGEASIDSSGVSRSTLTELLASLRFDGAVLRSTDGRLGTMFQQVAADDGTPRSTGASLAVSYDTLAAQPGSRDDFTVVVGPLGVPYDEAARQFFLSHRETVVVNAQDAVFGSDDRHMGAQGISFERAGLRITVAGWAARAVLLDAAQSVHVATGTELAALMAAGPPPAAAPGAEVELATATLAGGTVGSVSLDPTLADDGTVAVRLAAGGIDAVGRLLPRNSSITTVVSPTMVALVAFIPTSVGDAELVAQLGDPSSPTEVRATPVVLPSGLRAAAILLDGNQPFQASIATADGRALSAISG